MIMDRTFKKAALLEAKKAAAKGEVPIGAVIVHEGKIIARGHNERELTQRVLSDAELVAMERASEKLDTWRLEGCSLYVSLEPCQMCAGAIVQARMDRVVYGAADPKSGCAGSLMNLLQVDAFNHQVSVTSGVLSEECGLLLSNFFKQIREKKNW